MRRDLAVPLGLAVALVAGRARAGEEAPTPLPAYRFPVGLVSYSGLVLTLVGGVTGSPTVAIVGVGAGTLGGPIVHLSYGEPLRALGSLGLHVGLPVLGGFVGAMSERGCAPRDTGLPCGTVGAFVGGTLGMVAASVLDLVLAGERTPSEAGPVRPAVATLRGLDGAPVGATLVLSGVF
ncbi:MAG: hypothetical protein JNL79_32310 [Myxococcales bacterium]|nr:hypothetical protein [Myxococcales bacterium]